ncbi:MAG: hypothetical protein GX187_06795 [Clostridiaceae bacterium]|nr:hypothetical protein [Clostridiaceae bacterium]
MEYQNNTRNNQNEGYQHQGRKNTKNHHRTKYRKNGKARDGQYSRFQKNPSNTQKGSGSTTRYIKRNNYNQDSPRHIRASHIETVEDIIADIERVEKEIQFEIKQIRTIKLGL